MRSPADPIFWSHHALVDKLWARWQDCHNHNIADKAKLTDAQYRHASWNDKIDDSMMFKIGGIVKNWKPKPSCSGDSLTQEGNKCTACIKKNFSKRFKDTLCITAWHEKCEEYACNTVACRDACGTKDESSPLREIYSDQPLDNWGRGPDKKKQPVVGAGAADFKHKTLQDKWEYKWDHDEMGDTPRDWSLGTTKQKHPFHYQQDAFDKTIGAHDLCEMTWGKDAPPAPVEESAEEDGNDVKPPCATTAASRASAL